VKRAFVPANITSRVDISAPHGFSIGGVLLLPCRAWSLGHARLG
jgi:hypothetical protein